MTTVKTLLAAGGALILMASPAFATGATCPPGNNPNIVPFSSSDTSSSIYAQYQGYSMQAPRSPDGQGVSTITEVETTTTSGWMNTQSGQIFTGGGCPDPTTTTSTSYEFDGPGNSPAEQLLGDRVPQ